MDLEEKIEEIAFDFTTSKEDYKKLKNRILSLCAVSQRSEQYCGCEVKGAFETETLHRCRKCDKEVI